jgi:DNA-binding XRE family transcriptional regulator
MRRIKRRRGPRAAPDGAAFLEVRQQLFVDREAVAALLHVSERTVRNWEAGRAAVPYSALELLRIHVGHELPGSAWRGWRVRGEALVSPEGREFLASEFGWWSLTIAMARQWQEAQAESAALLLASQRPPPHGGEAQGGGVDARSPSRTVQTASSRRTKGPADGAPQARRVRRRRAVRP